MAKATFESVHEYGAKRFGDAWLNANRQVINMCMAFDIDYQKHRLGLSFIVLRILQYTLGRKRE